MAEKWQQNDTLRQMTSKFNTAVEEVEGLKQSSTQVNEATQKKFTEMETSVKEQFQQVNEELGKKLSSVTAEDIGLGEVDNTSDIDKPVSTAQQEAIDTAKTEVLNETSDRLTSEEAGTEVEDADDPEISPVIKNYIDKKIRELAALSVVDNFGIAETNVLGVVKATDDVNVDSATGKMTVPALATLKEEQENSKKRVDSIIQAVSKIGDDTLNTQSKTIIAAINELYNMLTSLNS